MESSTYAAAASSRTNLVIGLQNDMQNLNPFDPGTNSVWKDYQVYNNFETLFTSDPDSALYAVLADPAAACPAGTTVGIPGSCLDSSNLNITVNIRSGITFTNGMPLTADDVVFSYQTLVWSAIATSIQSAIWWPTPMAPLWNSTANGATGAGSCPAASPMCSSHVAVFKNSATQVRFQLTPHTVPGVTNGGYALIYYDTLSAVYIIPSGVWKNHLQTTPQINYSDPNLGPITDTWDQSISFAFGANPAESDATVGTGPFHLVSWTHNSGSKSQVYANYWGKTQSHTWKGTGYKFYPVTVTELDFIVYGSLDVVELALSQGTIDTLLWSLTPGFVNVVRSNPLVTVQTVTESGYFYISFNTRKAPWNDKCLREAISMAIDKNYIVNTLMGGYGIPGTVPIAIGNPLYINTSASPPAFAGAAAIAAHLTACGYRKNPTTGFFETSTGQPVSTTILTPPKDYDPVRADAGIMISNNLKAAGLNIEAAPTSFDTIVAKAFTRPVNFDIYILGWSLPGFPETYLCTFFCSQFDVNKNPAGQNSAGYSNPQVDTLINQLLYTTDFNKRLKLVQDVEGLLTKDIPWNTLYYRKAVVAWRNDAWQDWVLFPNGRAHFNSYSVVNLKPAGTVTVTPPAGALTVATSLPDQVFYRENVPIDVYVSEGSVPASGAAVKVNLTFGVYSVEFAGTADASGHFKATWNVPLIQASGVAVTTATLGSATGRNTKIMESVIGPPMPMGQLRLSTPTPVIPSTGTATITATLKDAAGNGMSGVAVAIDKNVTLGTVSPLTANTGASGTAVFTYTPPAAGSFVNSHFTDIVRASVGLPNTVAGETQTAQIVIVTSNSAAPTWNIVSLATTPPPIFFLNGLVNSRNYGVTVIDFTGAPVAGLTVDPVFTDTGNFTVLPTAPGSNVTDGTGSAAFTVSATPAAIAAGRSTTLPLTFQVHNNLFSTSDEILVFLANASSTGYGGYMSFGSRAMPYAAARTFNNVSVHLFNQAGAPAAGVPVIFKIDYGDFGLPAQFPFAIDYSCAVSCPTYTSTDGSLDLNSFGQGVLGGTFQSSVGQAWDRGVENMINDFEVVNAGTNFASGTHDGLTGSVFDACDASGRVNGVDPAPNPTWGGTYTINATSVTDAAGGYTLPFWIEHEKKDSRIQVQAFIGASGGQPSVTVNACAFSSTIDHFQHQISSGIVTQRAPIFALAQFTTDLPIATNVNRVVALQAQFKDVNGMVASPTLFLTQGAGSAARNVLGSFGGTQVGSASGWLNFTRTLCDRPTTCPLTRSPPSLTQGISFTYLPADTRYAYSARDQLFSGAFGDYWFAPTFEVLFAKLPFLVTVGYLYTPTTTAFLTVSVTNGLVSQGGLTQATVTTYSSLTGLPIAGANVWIGNLQGTSNSTGVAVFNVSATLLGANEGLVVATTSYGGAARGWYAVLASAPVLTYSSLSATSAQAGQPSTITVTAQNTLAVSGNATVWLTVDGNVVAGQTVAFAPNQQKTVTFTWVFSASGSHSVAVGSQTASVSISAAPLADQTFAYVLSGGLLVAGIVVGAVIGLMMGRRRKPPTSMPGSPPSQMGRTDEEIGEDNL
ncbi:MAG TPA: ABC transporter substrate-binding protein [Thermoplasmata archaeon]|nr:ABC transporter substrate-binding protein [Thermoplasmata archaeon]